MVVCLINIYGCVSYIYGCVSHIYDCVLNAGQIIMHSPSNIGYYHGIVMVNNDIAQPQEILKQVSVLIA